MTSPRCCISIRTAFSCRMPWVIIQDAVGYYKGRSYAEKLLVAYTAADVAGDFVRIARILEQECYAYERDGELFIAK